MSARRTVCNFGATLVRPANRAGEPNELAYPTSVFLTFPMTPARDLAAERRVSSAFLRARSGGRETGDVRRVFIVFEGSRLHRRLSTAWFSHPVCNGALPGVHAGRGSGDSGSRLPCCGDERSSPGIDPARVRRCRDGAWPGGRPPRGSEARPSVPAGRAVGVCETPGWWCCWGVRACVLLHGYGQRALLLRRSARRSAG